MRLKWESLLSASMICAAIGVAVNAPLRAQSAPCQQIRTACKNAGFVQGGPIGERLVLDCFNPIVLGQMPKRPASRPLPQIGLQLAAACRDSLSKQSNGAGDLSQLPVADASTLIVSQDDLTVHDTRLAVTWLADANLAAKQSFGVPNINKSGSMDYATAVRWVAAMNALNNGAGFLGHNNWQLPTAPSTDKTCQLTGPHGEPFGYHCSGSALGSLYYVSLGLQEPDSAVANSENHVGPFQNFQPYLYWSKSPAIDPKQGFVSFSFSSGFQGANVMRNYLHVLPMFKGKLRGVPSTADRSLQVDTSGKTVYDPIAQVTRLADANFAASQTFGVAGINRDGSMDHNTALLWVKAMNESDGGHGYLGRTDWDLPDTETSDPSCSMKGFTGFGCTGSAMGSLFYRQIGLHPGDSVVPPSEANVGPFYNVQPYLYWVCAGDAAASPCRLNGPADGFEWNFSFGNGFQGTNLVGNNLFVMVYYTDAPAGQPAAKP
ncbi:MAG: hypothetical protein ABR860_05540 [Terracidiphilus sp.]